MLGGTDAPTTIQGTLRTGSPASILTAGGKRLLLEADARTTAVLADARLDGAIVEVHGRLKGPERFQVGPSHQKSLHVIKERKKLLVSYWCDVCAVRTYEPGVCVCCQDETALDLKESFDP